MKHIVDYVESGRPVIGLRTAGRMVLGETWIDHHGEHNHQSTLGILVS